MAGIITEIALYIRPYCLEPVESIQEYLRNLDIYEIAEMKVLSSQYQAMDGDQNITANIYDKDFMPNAPAPSNPNLAIKTVPSSNSPTTQGVSPRNSQGPETSPRDSLSVDNNSVGGPARTASSTNVSPKNSPRNSSTVSGPSNQSQLNTAHTIDIPNFKLKSLLATRISSDPEFKKEIASMFEGPTKEAPKKGDLDDILVREFPNSRISFWKVTDNQGTVFGWNEEISAKIVQTTTSEVFIAPLIEGCTEIDKSTLAVYLRVGLLYESMNRFTITTRPKIVIVNVPIAASALQIAQQCGVKIL